MHENVNMVYRIIQEFRTSIIFRKIIVSIDFIADRFFIRQTSLLHISFAQIVLTIMESLVMAVMSCKIENLKLFPVGCYPHSSVSVYHKLIFFRRFLSWEAIKCITRFIFPAQYSTRPVGQRCDLKHV